MEAEYIALSEAAREHAWAHALLHELLVIKNYDEPTVLNTDSQAAIYFGNANVERNRSKHIGLRLSYLKEQIAAKKIRLNYIPTQVNVADILTKGLPKFRHHELSKSLGLGALLKN